MVSTSKQFRKRNAILAYLRNTKEHPSAETVFSNLKGEFPDLSLGTVYRNLSMFRQQGSIVSLGTVNGVERFDANTQPHVHFVCTCCNSVTDLPTLEIPEAFTQAAAQATGGTIDACQLSFTGTCINCLAVPKNA